MSEKLESKKSMKLEAINRMKNLGLAAEAIDEFNLKGNLLMSDYGQFKEVPEDIKRMIDEWEGRYFNLVYHVIHSKLCGFETYECLSVSCYKSDWIYENKRLSESWPMSHSINITNPDFTESGTIFVKEHNGTLLRMG
jgi:hypothetical protein